MASKAAYAPSPDEQANCLVVTCAFGGNKVLQADCCLPASRLLRCGSFLITHLCSFPTSDEPSRRKSPPIRLSDTRQEKRTRWYHETRDACARGLPLVHLLTFSRTRTV